MQLNSRVLSLLFNGQGSLYLYLTLFLKGVSSERISDCLIVFIQILSKSVSKQIDSTVTAEASICDFNLM